MKSFEFLEFLGRQKTEQSSNDRVSFEASHEKNIRIIEGNLMKSTLPSQQLNLGQPIMMTSQQSQFEPHAFVQLQKESIRPAHRTSNQEQTTVDQNRGLATDFTRFLLMKRLAIGLMRIWERLEERYDRPEMIDSALKAKLHPSRNYQIKTGKNSTI